ncbi:HAMP domain-containing sensor histidine kinase [Solwaraspora sp. WMMD937]|uniref:sensor histidine kinase n=1 Tax=Solwaraspora sp. WMMD937 TaxID=3016090 RepID=UPI00249B4E2C|nr:HAMP domain-containing sensor histidine kinase [Solwaraspora sp. WMMD937]WFE22891.1 HAMP domain-containing sensor histidine kinase [Solwaraspora sp. WMMD937]
MPRSSAEPFGTSWAAAERKVIARARLRVGALVGLAVTALVTLVGGIAYGMLVHGQEKQIDRELRYTASRGDPSGPPGCTWLFLRGGGEPQDAAALAPQTAGVPAPAGFPLRQVMETVAATGIEQVTRIERNGTVYFVLTQPRGDDTIQAVFDARYHLADRRQLLLALSITEGIGLLAALASGMVVGWLTVAPLAEALVRQRRFIADASHELRTPIAQVHTRAQVLARRARTGNGNGNIPSDYAADLDRLVGTTRQLGEVVDDLLLSARLGAAPADRVSDVPVDLAAVVENAVLAESDRAQEYGVVIALDRSDGPLPVAGVSSALRRVVSELLTNALRHSRPGGRIDVVVCRAAVGDTIELTVADTGEGFDPDERIFDRFHRGAGADRLHIGLGLALLREVVTAHRGTIEAAGHPGAGAKFTVRLPAAVALSDQGSWACTTPATTRLRSTC